MPIVAAVFVVLVFTGSAVFVPGQAAQKNDWAISDRLLMFLLGIAIAAFLLRFAFIRAVPSREGIVVRNLLLTRSLEWSEIVRLQFGGGSPWAYLDTWDADTVPVMAIQKADGAFGRAEAARLAALIDFHAGREPGEAGPTRAGGPVEGEPGPTDQHMNDEPQDPPQDFR
ncbi:PH domain-containing protein [Mobilicoccus massiliensis]|uniref:PH domain-containing protein n=1 Tax=Mobilicoccus massiliensis TaxID=1522310 RepID=UPI001FE2E1A3|nr:PH domain-containing protein [Mobilicoccus massiliensis]